MMIERMSALRARWVAVSDSSGRTRLERQWVVVEPPRAADGRNEAQPTAA